MKAKNDKSRMRKRRFSAEVVRGDRLYIDDDDFHWDVLMRISGDFEDDAEKLRYAMVIAKVLSDNEDKIPYRPLKVST